MRTRTAYTRGAALLPSVLGAALVLLIGSCDQYPTEMVGLEPPSVTGFQMTPDSANVTSDDVEIAITVGARGTGGVDSAVVAFADPNDADALSCVARQPATGDRANGDWSCDILLASGSAPGIWYISRVELHHSGGEVLRLLADDLEEAGYDIDLQVLLDLPPTVAITEPADGARVVLGDTVHFEGWGISGTGGTGSAGDSTGVGLALADSALVWTSDLDGQLGVGESFATAELSEGSHTITLTATDTNGLSASDSIRIRVMEDAPVVASIEITPAGANLEQVGDTVRFRAVARDAAGEAIPDVVFSWTSVDTAVAVVDADGLVTARGLGLTQIMAQVGGVGRTALLSVGGPEVEITAPADSSHYTAGSVIDLEGSARSRTGVVLADSVLVWSSSIDGELGSGSSFSTEALSPGTHMITLTATDDNGLTSLASITVIVSDAAPVVAFIAIEPYQAGLAEPGDTVRFRARGYDRLEREIPGLEFTWTLDNPDIIDMEADGATALITARVPGATFVEAAVGAISATARVAVGVPGVGITAGLPSGMEAGYLYGTEIRFEGWGVSQAGEELTGAALVWSSDFDGEFGTGERVTTSVLSAGPQRITLTATDAFGLSASAEIEFMIYPAEGPDTVVIAPQGHNFQQVGETFQFQARAYRSTGQEIPSAPIRWLSQYPEIVEIDADGRATARGEGTTQIAALINTGLDVIEVTVGPGEPHDEIFGIFVSPWRTTVPGLGGTTTLTATAVDHTYENPVPGVVFNWISRNPGIATVDQNGVVTGHLPGTARIIAAAGGIESSPVDVYVFEVGAPIAWDTIVAGPWHSCGLKNGTAYCWGSNENGELGTGDTENRFVPTRVADGHFFTAISLGDGYTLALDQSGAAWGWGKNDFGQLGDGSTTNRIVPTRAQVTGVDFLSITAGADHTLAISTTGKIYSWGSNDLGQLGNAGMPRDNTVPVPVETSHTMGQDFIAVSAGFRFSVALRSDSVALSWGYNFYGQLGHGDRGSRIEPGKATPEPIISDAGPHRFATISAGSYHTLALDGDGQAWAWGEGAFGRLGNGSGAVSERPVQVLGNHSFRWVGAGDSHSMAIDQAGMVWGWGEGLQGQLGDGTNTGANLPKQVAQGFVLLSPGNLHTLGLDANGIAYAWGRNSNGMLGDGRLEDTNTPVQVLGPKP